MHKIEEEVKAVMGQNVGFNIEVEESASEGFTPEFKNNFRDNATQGQAQENIADNNLPHEKVTVDLRSQTTDKPLTVEEQKAADEKALKEILNSYGAFNISED